MKKIIIILALISVQLATAATSFLDSVERTKWGEMEVVWIEDDKFPKFTASIYYDDGAISDTFSGLTQSTFDLMASGTSKESQREISDFFDFYGVNLRHSVTHEYTVYTIQALIKDMKPVVSKVCEIMNDAQFPANEVKSHVSRSKSRLKNLVTSHGALADRIFRQVSLEGTPYSVSTEGTLNSLGKLNSSNLKNRLAELNKARKVLYLAGPSEVKDIRKVLEEKCKWRHESVLRPVVLTKPAVQSAIYLVPVSGANQAQIRIGRYMTNEEIKNKHDQFHFLAGFLGGGFTSKLVQELRVKRGLTYSAGAYVSMQRDYGRAGIMTFSKSETTAEAIALVRDIFSDVSDPSKITEQEFRHQKGHQIGAHAFSFEETNSFLGQIMLYDHQGRKLQELVDFPQKIETLSMRELAQSNMEAFTWERQTIVVVGDKSLAGPLSKIRPVRVLDFEKFL